MDEAERVHAYVHSRAEVGVRLEKKRQLDKLTHLARRYILRKPRRAPAVASLYCPVGEHRMHRPAGSASNTGSRMRVGRRAVCARDAGLVAMLWGACTATRARGRHRQRGGLEERKGSVTDGRCDMPHARFWASNSFGPYLGRTLSTSLSRGWLLLTSTCIAWITSCLRESRSKVANLVWIEGGPLLRLSECQVLRNSSYTRRLARGLASFAPQGYCGILGSLKEQYLYRRLTLGLLIAPPPPPAA
jgi:hypothetical protein